MTDTTNYCPLCVEKDKRIEELEAAIQFYLDPPFTIGEAHRRFKEVMKDAST